MTTVKSDVISRLDSGYSVGRPENGAPLRVITGMVDVPTGYAANDLMRHCQVRSDQYPVFMLMSTQGWGGAQQSNCRIGLWGSHDGAFKSKGFWEESLSFWPTRMHHYVNMEDTGFLPDGSRTFAEHLLAAGAISSLPEDPEFYDVTAELKAQTTSVSDDPVTFMAFLS